MNKMSTTTEEWGNIELPGLSDDKLFTTNWHHVGVNRERGKTDQHKQTSTKNNFTSWQDHIVRENRLQGIRLANKKPDVIAKKTQANRKKAKDPVWKEKNLANIMSRARPIIDDQNNVYESLTDCARKLGKAVGTIQYYIKKKKFNYL